MVFIIYSIYDYFFKFYCINMNNNNDNNNEQKNLDQYLSGNQLQENQPK